MKLLKEVKRQQKEGSQKQLTKMQVKKAILKDTEIQRSFTQKRFKESISVCSWLVDDLLKQMESQLSPDTERVLTYSGLMMKKATQKIVNVNLLESEYLNNFTLDNNEQRSIQQLSNFLYDSEQNSELIMEDGLGSTFSSPQKSFFGQQSKVYSPKLVQDEEIIRKKQAIKFIKKQELKNLIKHRSSNTFSSVHGSYNPTHQRINTKHSLYQMESQNPKKTNNQFQTRSVHQYPNKTVITNPNLIIPSLQNVKSAKNFSTLKLINKNKEQNLNINKDKNLLINRERISALMSLGQFINLNEYYQQKSKQSNKNQNNIFCKENLQFNQQNKDKLEQISLRKNKNVFHPTWPSRQSQQKDEDDIVINKLRDRKQKFYKSQNNFNERSFSNTDKKATIMMNQSQKNSQKDQFGAIVAFDYNGGVMPTVKYDALKIPQHFQEMDFAVVHHDDSLMKRKKQRRGYILGGAINLKLVDHQKFMPHPSYNHEPLIQKQGVLMKQNIGYLLKKGVQVRPKQENTGNTSSLSGVNDQDQTRERINKGNFQFLQNQQIEPKGVKFQQFLRYKKVSLSSNKNISSKKRINDQTSMWEESMLSKKSISIKGLKNKPVLEDGTNKVHKSTNPKTMQMLINANHNDMISKPTTIVHFDNNQITGPTNTPNGVLKKAPLNGFKLIPQDSDNNVPKKKVRIA